MRLIECLELLPEDIILIDLSEVSRLKMRKKVREIKEALSDLHKNEQGYEIRERKLNYGTTTIRVIGLINGPSIYNEDSA